MNNETNILWEWGNGVNECISKHAHIKTKEKEVWKQFMIHLKRIQMIKMYIQFPIKTLLTHVSENMKNIKIIAIFKHSNGYLALCDWWWPFPVLS